MKRAALAIIVLVLLCTCIRADDTDQTPSELTSESVQQYADTPQRIDTVIEQRPDLLPQLDPSQVRQANAVVIDAVSPQYARQYIDKRILAAGGSFAPDPGDRNEWSLWKKSYPNSHAEDSLREAGVELGAGTLKTPQGEIDFGSRDVRLSYTTSGLEADIGEDRITLHQGKISFDPAGHPVLEKGSDFTFLSALTGGEVHVTDITNSLQIGHCESSAASCIMETSRERVIATGELADSTTTADKRSTKELELNLKDGISVTMNLPSGGYSDVNVKKQDGSSALFNMMGADGPVTSLYFPPTGNPVMMMYGDGTAGKLNPNFHYTFADGENQVHDAHLLLSDGDYGECITCSTCKQGGRVNCDGSLGVPVRFQFPAVDVNGNKVVLGGTMTPVLDKKWYGEMTQLASKYGVDPTFFMAVSMLEYGGYRVNKDPEGISSRVIGSLPVGQNFVTGNGAAGILFADNFLKSGVIYNPDVQKKLQEMGAPQYENPYYEDAATKKFQKNLGLSDDQVKYIYAFWPQQYKGTATQEQLDAQSFVLLKKFQDSILSNAAKNGGDIVYGLQTFNGVGTLPFLYAEGKAGPGKEIRYDASTGTLQPQTPGQYGSGVTGSQVPVYGISIATLIQQLKSNPQIQAIIPKNAPSPITSKVVPTATKK